MSFILSIIKIMRPTQWIKNGFVFMPLIFSGRLSSFDDCLKAAGMAFVFCLTSSATYIINDYMDMEQDRIHPRKRNRPLASGELQPIAALITMVLLIAAGIVVGLMMHFRPASFVCLVSYLCLQLAYSLKLKNIVIVDVLAISTGFLLRVMAGAVVISVTVSSWLILCTFSIAILLPLGKRRHEAMTLRGEATSHRPVLDSYSTGLLDQLLQVVTTSTFIFYCLYSVREVHTGGLTSERMMFTIPLVTYGIFRYLYLIYQKKDGGSPTAMLLTDPPLLCCTILWLAACVTMIYF